MNIQPVKSDGVPAPARPKTPPSKAPEAPAEAETPKTESQARLRDILAKEPAVRPEEVERGKALAADPNYPSADLLGKLAEMLARSRQRHK
jgi:hypothetical protein